MSDIAISIVGSSTELYSHISSSLQKDSDIALNPHFPSIEAWQSQKDKNQTQVLFLETEDSQKISSSTNSYNLSAIPSKIWVSTKRESAATAYELGFVDFLLKPLKQDRIHRSLDKAVDNVKILRNAELSQKIEGLLSQKTNGSGYIERLTVKNGDRMFFIPTKEIQMIEAEGNYVGIHANDRKFMLRETMINMEKKLDPNVFVRIHRSSIVNLDYVKEMQSYFHGDFMVILHSGKKLTLSRNYKKNLNAFLEH